MFLICEGLYVGVTGMLLFEVDMTQNIGGLYAALASLISLDAWGIVFIVSGLLLIVSAFQKGKLKHLSMLIGGFLGGILLILYGVAGLDYSVHLAIGMRYAVVGIFMLIIAGIGGRELWVTRHTED